MDSKVDGETQSLELGFAADAEVAPQEVTTLPAVSATGERTADRYGNAWCDEAFDWLTDESVIINDQPATAVYANRHGQLVIRQQRAWDQDEDVFVVIDRAHLPHLIEMLRAEAQG